MEKFPNEENDERDEDKEEEEEEKEKERGVEEKREGGRWITSDLLEEVIGGCEKEKVRIVGMEIRAAVSAGNNYMSDIYRAVVRFERKTGGKPAEERQLILKGMPESEYFRNFVGEYDLFENEMYMYGVFLPKMKNAFEEYSSGRKEFLAPRSYACSLPNVLVLEDLKASGYEMVDRNDQLDFEHATVTLKSLALFHALSAKVRRNHPDVSDKKFRGFYDDVEKLELDLISTLPSWIEEVGNWPGSVRFRSVLIKNCEGIREKVCRALKVGESFEVLNHGDPWTNNILFKYDRAGKVTLAKFVDYQTSRYASPAVDIIYFLFTSVRPEVLRDRYSDLLKIYHDALSGRFSELGMSLEEQLPFEKIRREIEERRFFILMVLATVTPVILAKPDNVLKMTEVADLENGKKNPLERQWKAVEYKGIVEKYLSVLERYGYLNE